MSLLNLCLQWVAWARGPISNADWALLLKGVTSIKAVRAAAKKNPNAARAWAESMEPVLRDLAERVATGSLRGEPFRVAYAATAEDVAQLQAVVKDVSNYYDPTVTTVAKWKIMPGVLNRMKHDGGTQYKYLTEVRAVHMLLMFSSFVVVVVIIDVVVVATCHCRGPRRCRGRRRSRWLCHRRHMALSRSSLY